MNDEYVIEVESSGELGTKLSVNLILNVIEVHFRLIETHFDHNQNIIKIFIFDFPIGPYGVMYKF